jgi:hypothetical protein
MKRIRSLIAISAVVFITSGCGRGPETTSWQLSGVARFSQAPIPSGTIKMAVFFPADPTDMIIHGPNSAPVSNVIDLGTTTYSDKSFTLDINPPEVTPQNTNTEMFLLMWKDSNGNDLCDSSESFTYAHSQTGDPVFRTENLDRKVWLDGGHWYYEPTADFFAGTRTGWNQRKGTGYVPIDEAKKTNAKLTNTSDTYW